MIEQLDANALAPISDFATKTRIKALKNNQFAVLEDSVEEYTLEEPRVPKSVVGIHSPRRHHPSSHNAIIPTTLDLLIPPPSVNSTDTVVVQTVPQVVADLEANVSLSLTTVNLLQIGRAHV